MRRFRMWLAKLIMPTTDEAESVGTGGTVHYFYPRNGKDG